MVYRFQYFISDFRFELKEAQVRYCFKWDLTLGQNGQNFTRPQSYEWLTSLYLQACEYKCFFKSFKVTCIV